MPSGGGVGLRSLRVNVSEGLRALLAPLVSVDLFRSSRDRDRRSDRVRPIGESSDATDTPMARELPFSRRGEARVSRFPTAAAASWDANPLSSTTLTFTVLSVGRP